MCSCSWLETGGDSCMTPRIARVSEREARAAQRAPEALEVADRRGSGPGAAVVVAMHAASARAAARVIELPVMDCHAAPFAGGGVPAKATHRRPIRHCRWR